MNPIETECWEELKCVYDPEIPVNIVDLGLVYAVEAETIEKGAIDITVTMTLTHPGCTMGPYIMAQAKDRLSAIPDVKNVTMELVWDPPWTQERLSEAGKMQLGLL
ncbi:MAG: hypothetical protein A2Y14_03305 [Verrucomicrobia bacterium GWF2_51_19]|nr:MAG: hypothetical protein A2Y14_03305 [Verrucomicrobia bacterium GWF2_51_19]HCJ11751.1 hypothetical protein [Opitutae bacterium]